MTPGAPAARCLDLPQGLLEHSREGTLLVGVEGEILYANPAIARVLGRDIGELEGNFLDFVHPEDRPSVTDTFNEVLSVSGASASGTFRVRSGDATWHGLQATWINQLATPGVQAIITHFNEIGSLPQPAQAFDLARTREFGVLIENAVHITAILELDGTVRYVSPAVERMLGYSPSSLLGTNVSELIHPEDRTALEECFVEPVGQRRPGQLGQFRARHIDGSWRVLEAIITNRLHEPQIGGIVVDARDVTERKWSAERLEHSLEALLAINQRLEHSLEALLAINQVGRLLDSNPEQHAIGTALLESARRVAPIDEAVLLLRTPRGSLAFAGASPTTGALWSRVRRNRSARAARQQVLQKGGPQLFRARPADSDLGPIEAWDLPLRAQERVIGILEVYGTDIAGGSGIEELSILADQAASALERARLYRELAERERRLEALVRQLLLAQEDERRRVAYEIHDGLAQLAWAAQQHVEAFAASYRTRNRERRNELSQALTLAGRTVREARRVIAGLRPAILDDFGLASAIAFELQSQRAEGREVEFRDGLGQLRLDPTLETALFRVVQEALTNVRKHAQSKRVVVTLERRTRSVYLEIRDWGRGFRPSTAQAGGGPSERVGLSGMQERIALINGRLTIRSRPGWGTRVQVLAPLREARAQEMTA